MKPKKIALVTSAAFPGEDWKDRDTPPLEACLSGKGHTVEVVAWDTGDSARWDSFDLVVLQSPWSMWRKLAVFGEWLGSLHRRGIPLANPHEVVVGGMSKAYLPRVAREGAVTIPTAIVRPGGPAAATGSLDQAEREFGSRAVVVKPISSGGALDAVRLTTEAELSAKLREFSAAGTTVCVQPYITSIDSLGEVGAVMIGGRLSHVITKDAILQPGKDRSGFHPNARICLDRQETDAEDIDAAHRAYLATVETDPASVRLDFLRHPRTGRLLLLEIESVAPVKFLDLHPAAVEDYATTLTGLLDRG
ncbi:hypothetical protein OG943_05655 [Amycolatopsis sp. NBC_00345]|uniref:ATP-grasp domain-containing protein n=1 Tax=Amycolatopsis sp. NBC_00345 TaxID=2975955 RepID=UPI002E27012D